MKKDKKANYGGIIAGIIVVILFLPIVIDYINNLNITVLTEEEISQKIVEKDTFLIYVGDVDKKTMKHLRKIRDKKTDIYSYEYGVYIVEDSEKIDELVGKDTKVAFIIEGDIQLATESFNFEDASDFADIYFVGDINDENKSYKVAESFTAYKELVNSDNITMAVFGRSDCSHCRVYKLVYNAIAQKYGVDIYYFESDSYDKSEYTKIVNMDLTVPGKCDQYGNEFNLSDGFGTPLTIFTKNGEVTDCIAGRVSRSKLVEKLKSFGMISE